MAAPKKKITVKKVKKTAVVRKKVLRSTQSTRKKISTISLKRSNKNPIIEPSEHRSWESKATFNPAAVCHDGVVHIIYRAVGDDDVSVLGYARSDDGHNIAQDSKKLAYHVRDWRLIENADKEYSLETPLYSSGGGGSGGHEDPRLTLLDDKIYMIYTSFDGWNSVRMTLTSINSDDFIAGRFNWEMPVYISPPEEIHKNWVLFPEKINGKYAILHSISPKIMIDYLDSLDELEGDNYIRSVHQWSPLWEQRDRFIRGVGPTPIKTKYGWLIFYHKMEKHDTHRYKLWAMILDAKDPTKILYNSNKPILEPDLWYENEGHKSGVVYSCGAVVKDGELFVYYGGADKVSCVATANLDSFLKEIINSNAPVLKSKKAKL